MRATRTERGWPGHYCCAEKCLFRRNTLIERGNRRVVVSTVGNLVTDGKSLQPIGHNRAYETMAFKACRDGTYWDADVSRNVPFDSPWMLPVPTDGGVGLDSDANAMHEAVVAEIMAKMESKEEAEA